MNYCLAFCCTLLLSTFSYADTVTATLDKKVVTENTLVKLTLKADFSNTGNGPDLSPLQKDFEVLGKSQNSQFSFNLGTSKALNFWVVSLMPKSVGTIEIPAIRIGDHQSQPIKLEVKSSPQLLDDNGNPPVIVRMEASNNEPYLQQQVILRVKLYTSVALQNANRTVPSHPDLVIERLSDDQMTYETINGTQYQVITRDYLSFPQRSGLLTISPQGIQAMVNTSFGRRLIKVQSEPLSLQVLPIPASYVADAWLPSQSVEVTSKLSSTSDTPRVGDTLLWNIHIRATGSLPEQIPTLDFNSTRNYKLYPQPPKFSTSKNANGVIGEQSIQVEVVPTAQGNLQLPDIDISYWDTRNAKLVHAVANTNSINIAPLPSIKNNKQTPSIDTTPLPAQPSSTAPISLQKKPEPKAEVESEPSLTAPPTIIESDNETWSFKTLLIYTLFAMAIFTLAWWIILRRQKPNSERIEESVPTLQEFAPLATPDEATAFQQLLTTCHNDQLSELRANLLEWARHRWGDHEIRTLDDIKRLTSVQVTQLLMEAELMMYSNNPSHEWHGEPLADALEEYVSGIAKPSQASQLKALYPDL
ncbi:BatD family protein [Marinomonas sp. THO17]|uniref:BatD family protein n=1 Tax=Marinomonas sp. THO17 TaxID=3149048 RepID=UPI00336BB2F6